MIESPKIFNTILLAMILLASDLDKDKFIYKTEIFQCHLEIMLFTYLNVLFYQLHDAVKKI